MTRPAPGARADYTAFRSLPTRWMDNDAYGHMNNATYLSLVDTAVSLWQMDTGIAITGQNAFRFLVVETGLRYHAQAGFPDRIDAGLRLGHLGRSSLRFEVGLFRNDDPVACTEAVFAQVLVDDADRPRAIPDAVRAVLADLVPPFGADAG